jgi:hypothetical protein
MAGERRARPRGLTPRTLGLGALGLGALLAGCSTAPAGEPWASVGSGLEAFRACEGPVELVFGPQGGYHVDLAAEMGGFEPDGVDVTLRLFDDASHEPIGYPTRTHLASESVRARPDGAFEWVGQRIELFVPPEAAIGRRARSTLQVVTRGRVLDDDCAFVIVDELP